MAVNSQFWESHFELGGARAQTRLYWRSWNSRATELNPKINRHYRLARILTVWINHRSQGRARCMKAHAGRERVYRRQVGGMDSLGLPVE